MALEGDILVEDVVQVWREPGFTGLVGGLELGWMSNGVAVLLLRQLFLHLSKARGTHVDVIQEVRCGIEQERRLGLIDVEAIDVLGLRRMRREVTEPPEQLDELVDVTSRMTCLDEPLDQVFEGHSPQLGLL